MCRVLQIKKKKHYMKITAPSIEQAVVHDAGSILIHLHFLAYQKKSSLGKAVRSPLKNTHFYIHACISVTKIEAIFKENSYSILLSQQK